MDRRHFDYHHPPINFLSEDFIAGFQPNSRMSVVRRFFCLFVTFDLIFVSLLWLICIVINGENIYKGLEEQVVNYSIETSLFDVVGIAVLRFLILILFYAIIQIDHWFVIALTTSFSCGFLITKVFFYTWPTNQQPFQVLLIIISFVISWFEAWFLDSRMIPQEEYSRSLTQAFQSAAVRESTPLLAPFLQSVYRGNFQHAPDSFTRQSFYSPVESVNSDDDEDEEYKQLGVATVIKAYELLESDTWREEKVTAKNDIIYTTVKPIGKVYKIKAKVNHPPNKLLYELFYKIENVPVWNPTLLESKILKTIDSNTDITYSVSTSGGGGMVKSRDFVNLRCWKLMNDSRVMHNFNIHSSLSKIPVKHHSSCDGAGENFTNENETTTKRVNDSKRVNDAKLRKSVSEMKLVDSSEGSGIEAMNHLSRSLGATNITCTSDDDEPFSDAQAEVLSGDDRLKDVFVSAAVSIVYAMCPPTVKFIRGENIVSCWAMRPVEGDESSCFFEWVLCLDMKGSIPKYVLNAAITSMLTDYMVHLRRHIDELNDGETQGATEDDPQLC